jgi:hypothetical protein
MKTLLPLVFALTFAVPLARAEDVLEIPESCGSHSELTREIDALRASSRSPHGAERPAVQLVRDGTGYALTVELADGRRVLRDPDCRALFRAAIVIAALGHESSVENVLDASEAQPAAPTPVAPVPALVPVAQAARPPAREEAASSVQAEEAARVSRAQRRARRRADELRLYPRKLSARALLRAELAYGLLPELNGVFGLGIALEYGRFSARAEFAYQGPPSTQTDGEEGVSVDALSGSLTLELVALPWLRPGIGVDFAGLRGRGKGGRSPQTDWATQPLLHAGLSARFFQRAAFWLEFSARALWAPEPVSFLMSGRPPLYTVSAWGLSGGIAAGYQFL